MIAGVAKIMSGHMDLVVAAQIRVVVHCSNTLRCCQSHLVAAAAPIPATRSGASWR